MSTSNHECIRYVANDTDEEMEDKNMEKLHQINMRTTETGSTVFSSLSFLFLCTLT